MKQNYSELKESLEKVLEKLQDPETDLDQAINLHAEGKKIAGELEQYLQKVESKIEKAKNKDT